MQYVRDSFWRGREFTSLEQMQAAAQIWCREVAGIRASRALDGQQPGFVFATVEQHALLPLPRSEFQLAVWSSGKVATDCHVKVGKALYSVPWRLMGQQVHARTCGDIVQIVHGGDVVATHVTHHGGRATDFEHYPPEKIAFTMRNPTWCRRVAAEVGPACTQVIAEFMEVNAIHRLRSAQGVLALRKTVGDSATGGRLRTSNRGGRSELPHRQGHPRRRHRTRRHHRTDRTAGRRPIFAAPLHSIPTQPARPRDPRPPYPLLIPTLFESHQEITAMSILDPALRNALRTLKLTGMLDTLDARLAQTRDGTLGHLDFLQVLCEDEIARRESAALTRRIRRARFEEQSTFESFDFTANTKLPAAMLRDLAALRWLDAAESVILYGPVGVGKTHMAQALGHAVARRGGDVRFAKTSRVLSDLAGGHADRTWGQRIREYTKPLVLILDDFAMREHTAMHADDLYELISDRAVNGRPLILTSNRSPKDWYNLFPNPVVAESLLDRLINTSHQILMDGPSYRPRKRPGATAPVDNTKPSR